MISLMRTKYGQYPEYHNSDDKLGTVVTSKGLYGGYNIIKDVIYSFEKIVFQSQDLNVSRSYQKENYIQLHHLKG